MSKFAFQHLLSIDDLSRQQILSIFSIAERFIEDGAIKKTSLLSGTKVANLFFEPSTRTRVTFEIAQKNLSAEVINLDIDKSSFQKGESLVDMLSTLERMGIKIFVVRHSLNGTPYLIANNVPEGISIINAGDGNHSHPTQALLDMATLRRYRSDFSQLTFAIIGDVLHSRVARSQLQILKKLGAKEIRIISPYTLTPNNVKVLEVKHFVDLAEGLKGVDVILTLRLQKERMEHSLIPSEKEFFHSYGLSQKMLKNAKSDVLVMHPGPVNRGVEISSSVLDGKHSLVLQQVTEGIAVRMAVMSITQNKFPD